jgi:hypothetical protein
MKERKKVTISRFWYILMFVIIAALLVLIVLFSLRAYHQYVLFNNHENYFRRGNSEIQSWMNIHTIERRFNITPSALSAELNISPSKITQTSMLNSLCSEYHLNCTEIVDQLNSLKT